MFNGELIPLPGAEDVEKMLAEIGSLISGWASRSGRSKGKHLRLQCSTENTQSAFLITGVMQSAHCGCCTTSIRIRQSPMVTRHDLSMVSCISVSFATKSKTVMSRVFACRRSLVWLNISVYASKGTAGWEIENWYTVCSVAWCGWGRWRKKDRLAVIGKIGV